MASYFVACHPLPDGGHAVHDRTRCPPSCFSAHGTEYLGEFSEPSQALAVARLRYATACGCPWCDLPLAGVAARGKVALDTLRW